MEVRFKINKQKLKSILLWYKTIIRTHELKFGSDHSKLISKIVNSISIVDNNSGDYIVKSSKYRDVIQYGDIRIYSEYSEHGNPLYEFEFTIGEENLRRELIRLLSKNADFGPKEYDNPTTEVIPLVIKTNNGLRVIT